MEIPSTTAKRVERPCILSLDHGGRRGLARLIILVELMSQLNPDMNDDHKPLPCDVFDMIGGAGSGGFTAILLVVFRLTADEALDEFIDLNTNVLESQHANAQSRTEALKKHVNNLLNRHEIELNTPLLDPKKPSGGCKLVVPISYKSNVESKCTLRNTKVGHELPCDMTVADALVTTLATLPLFTSISINEGTATFRYIGGGLLFSNPVRKVLAEAYQAFGLNERDVWLLSIGCGHPGNLEAPKGSDPRGLYSVMEKAATNAETAAQELEDTMGHLDSYHRFSVVRGLEKSVQETALEAGDIITHAKTYLHGAKVSREVVRCVDSLKELVGRGIERQPGAVGSHPSNNTENFAVDNSANACVGHTIVHLDNVCVSPKMDLGVCPLQTRDGVVSLEQPKHSSGETILPQPLPPLARTFVMRTEPWEYIKKAILDTANSGEVDGPRMLSVTGIGGCGKTQIILKFMRVYKAEFSAELFIDGSSASRIRDDIIRNVRPLAHSQMSFEDCLLFLARPSSKGPRLLVYDNVDDPDLDLLPLLPGGSGCVIIITSRNRSIGALCPETHLELDTMSMDEAVELLLYTQNRSDEPMDQARENARAVAKELGCLPIALQQARSYMYLTKLSSSAYLERFSHNRDKLLAKPVKNQPEMRYLSTYAAFDASIEILSVRARQLLQLLSFFHWSKFPLELVILAVKHDLSDYKIKYIEHGDEFQTGRAALEDIFLLNSHWDITDLDELIVSLQSTSLLTVVPGFDTMLLEMHPLLHGWVQSCLSEQDRLRYQSAAVLLLALGNRPNHTPSAQYLASHILHLSHLWGDLHLNNAAAFGEIMSNAGVFAGAILLQERVVAGLRGPAESLWLLERIYRAAGVFAGAMLRQERVVAGLRGPTDSRNASLADSLRLLGRTYRAAGRLKEAEVLHVEVLNLRKEILGEEHPDTITASNDVASVYYELGRLSEAAVLQMEVLRLRKEILGERHPDTIATTNNLAATYAGLGRLNEAVALHKEVLMLRNETLGERHPETISASNSLAATYYRLGRLSEAEALQLQVVKLRKAILGGRHPDTLSASSNLAAMYYGLGRLNEAELLQMEVLILRKEILGVRHPDTITASSNLALIYLNLGRPAEAEVRQVEVLKLRKDVLGEQHPDTITASSDMAAIYCELGRLDEAEMLLVKSLRLMMKILGERHLETITASSAMATVYREQGRLREAEVLQTESLRLMKEILGTRHFETIRAMLNLAEIYESRFDKTRALNLLDAADVFIFETLGDTHPLYRRCQEIKSRVQSLLKMQSPRPVTPPESQCWIWLGE